MTDPRVALVVGAAAGVGKRLALWLSDQRWRVGVCYRDQHFEAALLVRDLMVRARKDVQPVDCDFADPVAVARMVRYLEARFGAIDALIWAPTPADLPPGHPDPLAALADVVVPGMAARKWGRIVAIGGTPAVDLGAVAALAARARGHGVTVNAVTPAGSGHDAGLREVPHDFFPALVDLYAMTRFVLSDTAAGITGANLRVDRDWRDDD